MDDDALKSILSRDNAPEIDINARKRAVNLAVAAFESAEAEKKNKSSQGSSLLSRLTGMSNASQGRDTMEHKSKKKFIYGGMATAMAVVFVAAISVSQLDDTSQRFANNTAAGHSSLKNVAFSIDNGPPGKTQNAAPAYTAAIEEQNEADFEQALQTGGSTLPVAVETPTDRMAQSEENLTRWRKLQPERDGTARPWNGGKLDEKKQNVTDGESEIAAAPEPQSAPMKNEALSTTLYKSKESADTGMPAQRSIMAESIAPTSPPVMGGVVMHDDYIMRYRGEGRDKFTEFKPSAFKQVAIEPVSTFSSDVDTASYSFVRRQLNNGILPDADSVRVEEMINYFDYNYPVPTSSAEPFRPTITITDSPWAKGKKLMHIGIKGYEIAGPKPHTNLVFLLDVSGSMNEPNKLPLVKASMKMLLDTLQPSDTIAIAVYAGSAGTVLEPTKVSDRHKIIAAIDNLNAGGSTAGEAGINAAYSLAEQSFDKEGVNRIILATDGDFNVGTSSTEELKALVEKKRESGIFLSVLGFGQGNYNDSIMQTLAQNGNGVAAYIDTLNEAQKVLVEEAGSSLFPIAKDVKFQVEFNPAAVAEYRLVGYETRALNREDFNNDKIDAGDIGAGHAVTAIYEFVPVGSSAVSTDPLRYGNKENCQLMRVHADANDKSSPLVEREVCDLPKPVTTDNGEYAFLKIRYKLPNESVSKLIETPVVAPRECGPNENCMTVLSEDVSFSIAVAAFGQILKNDTNIQTMSLDDVIALAQQGKGHDEFGYRAEFINLARLAKSSQR